MNMVYFGEYGAADTILRTQLFKKFFKMTYACVRISATNKMVKLPIKTLHFIVAQVSPKNSNYYSDLRGLKNAALLRRKRGLGL